MEKPSSARIALKWGIITSIIISVYSIVLYMTGGFKVGLLPLLSFLILLLGLVLAVREYKALNSNFLNFGEGLGVGTLTSAVIGVISSIFAYIYTNMIDTTINQQMQDLQREQMESRGLTEEQINQAMEIASSFTKPGITFVIGLFFYILVGFVWSLLVAAIFKKDKPEF